MSKIKTEEDVIKLIGLKTILKFEYMVDNLMSYTTLIPIDDNGNLIKYKIELFYKDLQCVFAYDNLEGFLSEFQIFELIKVYEDNSIKSKVLYHNKYKGDE